MIKKITMALTVFILALTLTGCNGNSLSDTEQVLEIKNSISFDLLEIENNITIPSSDIEGVTLTWVSSKPQYLDIDGTVTIPTASMGDQNVDLSVTIEFGTAVTTKVFHFTVIAPVVVIDTALNTDQTDALAMDFTYEDTDFIASGIGEVTLVSCIDGDTAIFTEGGANFTVRFLGVDTPESTYRFDPWGKAASMFTCDKLTNATTIVLEYDPATTRTEGNGRYLSWIWYDGRLLNLELIEQAFSGSKGVAGLKYENLFYTTEFTVQDKDRRIWGEDDPDYDYSLDGVQITIEELVTNQELYVGTKVVITGVVSRNLEGHPYLQVGDYAIYLYIGYTYTTKLVEGNEVTISGLTPTYHPDAETGSLQLTGFTREHITVISVGNVVEPEIIEVSEIDIYTLSKLITIENLTVTDIYVNDITGDFTVTAEDSSDNTISIRINSGTDALLLPELFTVGTIFDVTGPLGRYEGNYQVLLIYYDDVDFK
ncbi:MAG: Thermonuclease precursor [Candidatus Izimaplasma bacterium HR2]|nr:MAG: Thermonuclease precursor [Candidatus Izimaplasma bacterium HR2]